MLVLRAEAIGIMTLRRDEMEEMHVDKLIKREHNMGFTIQEEGEEVIETGKGPGQGNAEMVQVRARGKQKANSVPTRQPVPRTRNSPKLFTSSSTLRPSNSEISCTDGYH